MIFITENGAYVCCRGYDMLSRFWSGSRSASGYARCGRFQEPALRWTPRRLLHGEQDQEFLDLIQKGYRSTLIQVDDVLAREMRINKMAVYRKENIQEIAEWIIPRWEDRLHCVVSGDVWVDFMNKGTDKGKRHPQHPANPENQPG